MSIFQAFMEGRQAQQNALLNQLKMQQAGQLFPLQKQLQELQIEKAQQAVTAEETKQQQQSEIVAGRYAEMALSIDDPEKRAVFLEGAGSRLGLQGQFDPENVPDEVLERIAATGKALQPQTSSKFGRVFAAKDAGGKMVWAQADDKGNVNILPGLTPMDYEQQRIDVQKMIADGRAEQERKEREKTEKEKGEKIAANVKDVTNTVSQVEAIIMDPKFDGAVGLVDQFTAKIGAQFGTKAGVVNKRAKRTLSAAVVSVAKSLGANPTDSDVQLLKDTMPAMGDSADIWRDWYTENFIPTINKRLVGLGQPELVPADLMTEAEPEAGSGRSGRNAPRQTQQPKRLRYNLDTGAFE